MAGPHMKSVSSEEQTHAACQETAATGCGACSWLTSGGAAGEEEHVLWGESPAHVSPHERLSSEPVVREQNPDAAHLGQGYRTSAANEGVTVRPMRDTRW